MFVSMLSEKGWAQNCKLRTMWSLQKENKQIQNVYRKRWKEIHHNVTNDYLWVRNWGIFPYLLAISKCSLVNSYKSILMGQDSINYFSKIEFSLGADPLPDQSWACWHGWGCRFSSNELNAEGWKCDRQCSLHLYLLGPCSGPAPEGAGEVGMEGGPQEQLEVPLVHHAAWGVQRKLSENVAVFMMLPYPNASCYITHIIVLKF